MIMEIIRYKLDPGQESAFEAAYGQAQRFLAGSPNCLSYQLTRCLKDRGRYVLMIEWDSLEGHLQGFRRSPAFREFVSMVAPYLNKIEEMEHYETTGVAGIKATS
jgi:hemoglobin